MRRALLSVDSLTTWARHNGIILNGVTITTSPSGHGTGLIASRPCNETGSIFVQVPSELLLNESRVWNLSSSDHDLATILAANGELTKSTRGAILVFLLMQIAHSSPDVISSGYKGLPIGKENVFSEYIQYIQSEETLPLFWSTDEIEKLWGTSLKRHHDAKMRFLRAEFETFKSNCQNLPWSDIWFGEKGCLGFTDWLLVDAMWRSRAMDLSGTKGGSPDTGACLVPIMDMANHTTEGIAAYKLFINSDGSPCARLSLDKPVATEGDTESGPLNSFPPDRSVREGDEITISYGNIKGAAEMIFSYGFLDQNMADARSMMLSWNLPEDDPLRFEKVTALNLEPGIQIYTPIPGSQTIRFAGAAVWAMSVNEEDGLRIAIHENEIDEQDDHLAGKDVIAGRLPKLRMFFKNTLILSKSHLVEVLNHDRAALVFRTRAIAYVYIRIEEELQRLRLSMDEVIDEEEETQDEERRKADVDQHYISRSQQNYEMDNDEDKSSTLVIGAKKEDGESTITPRNDQNQTPIESPGRTHRAEICDTLRILERNLLEQASAYFLTQLSELMQHPDVVNYPTLLEQGLELPDLSGEEQWNRYEGERDVDSRHEYANVLVDQAQGLTEQGTRRGMSSSPASDLKSIWDMEHDETSEQMSLTDEGENEDEISTPAWPVYEEDAGWRCLDNANHDIRIAQSRWGETAGLDGCVVFDSDDNVDDIPCEMDFETQISIDKELLTHREGLIYGDDLGWNGWNFRDQSSDDHGMDEDGNEDEDDGIGSGSESGSDCYDVIAEDNEEEEEDKLDDWIDG